MAQLTYSQLVDLDAQKDRRIAELEKLLEQRTRDGKRQAAPFDHRSI